VDEFNKAFPDYNLTEILSEFSFPSQFDEHQKVIDGRHRKVLVLISSPFSSLSKRDAICMHVEIA